MYEIHRLVHGTGQVSMPVYAFYPVQIYVHVSFSMDHIPRQALEPASVILQLIS